MIPDAFSRLLSCDEDVSPLLSPPDVVAVVADQDDFGSTTAQTLSHDKQHEDEAAKVRIPNHDNH